jgi:hypothetical protein
LGDNFLAGQRSHRQRGREQATAVLSRPTLFTRPDIINNAYPVTPTEGVTLAVGDVLDVYVAPDIDRVNFARGACVVGVSGGDSAAALRQALIETGEEGLRVEITKVSAISGVAEARVAKEDAGEESHRASA